MDTKILRNMSYGVYLVTSVDGDRPVGCTANSAIQITSNPATVAVSINHDNYTNGCIKKSGKFAISIMEEHSDASLIGIFGFQSSKDVDKFNGVSYEMVEGVPVFPQTNGYAVFKVTGSMETSTHTIFVGEMLDGAVTGSGTPMTYAYYHNVLKGKTAKNAPTYVEEKEDLEKVTDTDGKTKWRCTICGYIYEGDELPADFVCPICHATADQFEKVVE